MQPLGADHTVIPYMEAIYVPFHMTYSSLICAEGLQPDWVKMMSFIGRPQKYSKYGHKMPISHSNDQIHISADSPDSPLSDEV